MQKEHIKAHTGLRGIAAAFVALLHMHFEDIIPPHLWKPFMNIVVSWYPVDVFFMLSGFILGYVYIYDINKPKVDYKDYFIKRFARVVPLHYLTMFAVGLMAIVSWRLGLPDRGYHFSDILPQLLMVHAYPYIGHGGWNGPSWSISMEFFAYIFIFPLMTKIVAKVKNSYVLIALLFTIFALIWAVSEHATLGWPAITRVVCHFSIGYLLYALTTFKNPIQLVASKYVNIWLFLAITWVFTRNGLPELCSRMAFQIVFAFLILGLADNKASFSKTILGNRLFLWLGTLSYSIYMIHNLIGKVIHVFYGRLSDEMWIKFLFVFVMYGVLLALSWITYNFFEVPSRNYLIRVCSKYNKSVEAVKK